MQVINVLKKADLVLQALAENGELSVPELVERLSEPRTSVYRLLDSMQGVGWIESSGRAGRFRIGVKLFRMSADHPRWRALQDIALPVLEALHRKTGDTTYLCIREDLVGLCIERIGGARVQTVELRPGTSLPLHVGGAPRALLAFEPESWDDYLVRAPLSTYTDHTSDTVEKIRRMLEDDLAAGVVISDGDVIPGIGAMAAPIIDANGRVIAALSISGVASVLLGSQRATHEKHLREAAVEVSRAMGHPAPASD